MFKKVKKIIFASFIAFSLIGLPACNSSVDGSGDNSGYNQSGDNSSGDTPTKNPETKTIWSGSKDLNDTEWKTNLIVDKNQFAQISSGDQIKIYWTASSTATAYKKLQLDYAGSSWSELSGGTYTNGHKESGENSAGVVPDSNPLIYKVSSSDASNLKNNGLAIMGYGVVITKIEIILGNGSGSNSGNDTPETPITPNPKPVAVTGTPFANHGALHVDGAYIYDSENQKYQLYGMSTHGISWFPEYVNKDGFESLLDDWNTNCVRLVLYPQQGNGYLSGGNQATLKQKVCDGIDYATELGMYVLVDWHVHEYNPNNDLNEAKKFLGEIAAIYKNYDNVLYEICNEPTGTPWSSLKTYAEAVIPVIREQDSNAVIIVGTNTWSQDIHEVGNQRPADSNGKQYANIMYTFHFYANTHTQDLRNRVEKCINDGLPVFITEFGTCDASGNGGFNKDESQKWFDLCSTYNISHMNWSLCNKDETASAISSGCSKTSGWEYSDLTESGKLIYDHFRSLTK